MSTTAASPASTNCVTAAATDFLTRRRYVLPSSALVSVHQSPSVVVGARVHVAVDLLLHARGTGHHAQPLLAALARRLDEQVARPDEPSEQALVIGDVVDALE